MNCPLCKSKQTIKKGFRKTRYSMNQRYYCKECKKYFSDSPIKQKVYLPHVIFDAINFYNTGHDIRQVSKQLNSKYKIKTSKSIIHNWIHEYQNICPISSNRKQFLDDETIIFSKKFQHENLDYIFKYHKYKLKTLTQKNFSSLYRYIKRFETGCPDVFFEVGKRCSTPSYRINIKARKTRNLACDMTRFAIKSARNNFKRHDSVEQFMLINDKASIACEIPVWYYEKRINSGVTGHIDILQVRNNHVYILDYKPDAAKNSKAAGQLYHYALALSFRAKIPMDHIRCAWFDEDDYFEYAPLQIKVKLKIKP